MHFEGTAEIEVDISAPVSSITLNVAAPLQLHSAVLRHSALKTESTRPATAFEFNQKRERVTITFAGGEIAAGQATIGLRFESPLEPSMMGYYASTYPLKGGEKGEMSAYGLTQFEPTQARRAFPCFDEPDFKATYTTHLVSRTSTVSLSNMPVAKTQHLGPDAQLPRTALLNDAFFQSTVESTSVGKTEGDTSAPVQKKLTVHGDFKNDWELVSFEPSVKMSTYLVAWANGVFEHIEDSYVSPLTGKTVPMRVYTTYEHIGQAALALETKVRIMPIYEKMFDVAYPLPKLDTLVASDFDAGAMENYGLITGRTSVYLYDEKKSGIAARKRVVSLPLCASLS